MAPNATTPASSSSSPPPSDTMGSSNTRDGRPPKKRNSLSLKIPNDAEMTYEALQENEKRSLIWKAQGIVLPEKKDRGKTSEHHHDGNGKKAEAEARQKEPEKSTARTEASTSASSSHRPASLPTNSKSSNSYFSKGKSNFQYPHYSPIRDFRREVAVTNRTIVGSLAQTDPSFKVDLAGAVCYEDTPNLDSDLDMDGTGTIKTKYHLMELDSFSCAEFIIKGLGVDDSNVAVLNMANQYHPGGGYLTGASAQEESLCRRSSLFAHLGQRGGSFYPMEDTGGIWTPGVRVFRDEDDKDCEYWEDAPDGRRFKVGVISVAAIDRPKLTDDGQSYFFPSQEDLTIKKIDTILSIAVVHKVRHLVLGAFGCGAFANPPRLMARLFKDMLTSDKFTNRFDRVFISIIERSGSQNAKPWKEIFHDMLTEAAE